MIGFRIVFCVFVLIEALWREEQAVIVNLAKVARIECFAQLTTAKLFQLFATQCPLEFGDLHRLIDALNLRIDLMLLVDDADHIHIAVEVDLVRVLTF